MLDKYLHLETFYLIFLLKQFKTGDRHRSKGTLCRRDNN